MVRKSSGSSSCSSGKSSRSSRMSHSMSRASSTKDVEVTVEMTDGTRKSLMPIAKGPSRKSVAIAENTLEGLGIKSSATFDSSLCELAYEEVLAQARLCQGHGQLSGSFPEEWDAQLLVDCGCTNSSGARLVIFTPAFLKYCLEDDAEMDLAFKFVLLKLDPVASASESYIFVWCCHDIDVMHTMVYQRVKLAFQILPKTYSRNLRSLIFLHPNIGFKVMVWAMWPWITTRVWGKIEFADSIAELHMDPDARQALQHRFPLLVQREDERRQGTEPQSTFGMPAETVASMIGVNYTDKTTGRRFSSLPSPLVFICEMLERQAGQLAFPEILNTSASHIKELVAVIDEGEALDPDTPLPSLWRVLKLFLDCLPTPLLSFAAFSELQTRRIGKEDVGAQLDLLRELIHTQLSSAAADMTLYLASFLHTMCLKTSAAAKAQPHEHEKDDEDDEDDDDSDATESTQDSSEAEELAKKEGLMTPTLAGQVFAPGFIRPQRMDAASCECMPVAAALVVTLIHHAEDPVLSCAPEAVSTSKPKLERVPSPQRPRSRGA